MENYIEDNDNNQESFESIKATNNHQKQEIYCLTSDLKLTKSSVADFQIEAKAMYSGKNIYIFKVWNLQGRMNAIKKELNITTIKKEEA